MSYGVPFGYKYIISGIKKSSIPESYKNRYKIIVEINKA